MCECVEIVEGFFGVEGFVIVGRAGVVSFWEWVLHVL